MIAYVDAAREDEDYPGFATSVNIDGHFMHNHTL
jgi:hypothetical protein